MLRLQLLIVAVGLFHSSCALQHPTDHRTRAALLHRNSTKDASTSTQYTIRDTDWKYLYVGQGRSSKGELIRYIGAWKGYEGNYDHLDPVKDTDSFWTITGPDKDGDVKIANVRWPEHYLTLFKRYAGTCTVTGKPRPPEAFLQSGTPKPSDDFSYNESISYPEVSSNDTTANDDALEDQASNAGKVYCPQSWLLYKPVEDSIHDPVKTGSVFLWHQTKSFMWTIGNKAKRVSKPYESAIFVINPPVPDSMIRGELDIHSGGWGVLR